MERGREPIFKNKKLKRTAIFIGLFLAAILLTFIFASLFRAPPEPGPTETETVTAEETTPWEETTAEEDSWTEPLEWTTEATTTSTSTTQVYVPTATRIAKPNTSPHTTSPAKPPTTTRPATTTRSTTTTKHSTTTKVTSTTTQPPVTTTRPPATTTNATDSLIAYGVNYGKSIGLTYRPQLTQGGEAISGATQQAIRNRLDQAKAARATEFNIWREGTTIYISIK